MCDNDDPFGELATARAQMRAIRAICTDTSVWLENLQPLIDGIPVGVSVHDSDSTVVAANQAAREWWDGGDYVGIRFRDRTRLNLDGTETCDGPVTRALASGRKESGIHACKMGPKLIWASMMAVPVEGPDGNRWVFNYFMDVTEVMETGGKLPRMHGLRLSAVDDSAIGA